MSSIISQGNPSINEENYNDYIKQVTPTHNTWVNVIKAFVVGGTICTIGQVITNLLLRTGLEKEAAAGWTTLTLIAASVILTGFNIYPQIVKFAGAGALVPITGFANSVVAPAIEYKKEGHVFGIGCKVFTIAGPVILFGIFSSWILGVIYYIFRAMGIVS